MPTGLDPNKAKTARRVIEVLEFFDEQRRQATVMDIARRYRRPQSSTSELLAILVEMGLLYKDASARYYTPTPRAAMLGSLFQPSPVRDGRLAMLTDRLVAQTGLGTALMGMVGLNVQMYAWMEGLKPIDSATALHGGLQTELCESAAGWLLLSTIEPERRDGVLRRLRAEAPTDRKIDCADLNQRIHECEQLGYAVGPAGFGTAADMCAVLLPSKPAERPMVLGLVYQPYSEIDPAALVALLQKSIQSYIGQPNNVLPHPSANHGPQLAAVMPKVDERGKGPQTAAL
jgi:DNA-binding IclR family transcriptional regulator